MKKYDPLAQYQFSPTFQQPSFLKRTLAFLVDMSLLSFTVFTPVSTLVGRLVPADGISLSESYQSLLQNSTTSTIITVVMLFVFTLMLLYFTISEYLLGQTAGKRLLGLKVEDSNGNFPTFWQCLIRNLVFLPIFPFILFWVIDPLYLAFSKQRLSEQLSRTRTVNYIKEQTMKIIG